MTVRHTARIRGRWEVRAEATELEVRIRAAFATDELEIAEDVAAQAELRIALRPPTFQCLDCSNADVRLTVVSLRGLCRSISLTQIQVLDL